MKRVKICCIQSLAEARLAIDAGASALGLVTEMPSGPGVASYEIISEILKAVPPAIGTFLLTSKRSANEIIEQHNRCPSNVIQLTDKLEMDEFLRLRDLLPAIKLVQVVHVVGEQSIKEAVLVAPIVDAILLDSGNPNLNVKELGGTGRVHDWRISRRIRDEIGVPLFLAGGLNAENVADGILQVEPFGIDICSGVRTDGALDPVKLRRFMSVVNEPRLSISTLLAI